MRSVAAAAMRDKACEVTFSGGVRAACAHGLCTLPGRMGVLHMVPWMYRAHAYRFLLGIVREK